jgi:hypothetical protein
MASATEELIQQRESRFSRLWRNLQQLPGIVRHIRNTLDSTHGQMMQITGEIHHMRRLLSDYTRWSQLCSDRYANPKCLTRHGFQAFSQFDEDGIIAEIFRRIGPQSRTFVEIGVGDGLENNTCFLLLQGWRGHWIEASEAHCRLIRDKFGPQLADGQLSLHEQFVTAKNIDSILMGAGVPADLDLLSIDIDGNDYWVYEAITSIRPRVLVLEYNPAYGPSDAMTIACDPKFVWQVSTYYGASLKAWELLCREKGYRLVGCGFAGVNAFFVQESCCGDHFAEPFTAEQHFEPARYELLLQTYAHSVGPCVHLPNAVKPVPG